MASSTYEQLVDAARDLDAAQQITSPQVREKATAQINTAMLIDIAASLRVIAESVSAPGAVVDEAGAEHVGELPASDEPAGDDNEPLEVGDRVAPWHDEDEHDDGIRGTIESIGSSEGEEFAVVQWDDGATTRPWLNRLRRVEQPDAEPDLVGWDAGNPLGDGTVTAPAEPVGAFEALTKAQKKAAKKAKSHGND